MSKRSVIQTNDGYLMLLDAVYFNGRRMGNISEEGLDWGGEDAQTVELWAAQIRTSPVLDIETRAATNEITGKMIEMVPDEPAGKPAGQPSVPRVSLSSAQANARQLDACRRRYAHSDRYG